MSLSTTLVYILDTIGLKLGSGGRISAQSGSYIDIESGASLKLAGTAITSNAAEVNSLDGAATTWPTLLSAAPTYTIGAEGSNTINVLCSLNDVKSTAIASSRLVLVYLSDSAAGDGITGTAPDGGGAIGTDGAVIVTLTASKAWLVWTESDGDYDINITHAGGADTWYVVTVVNDYPYCSTEVTFA